MARAAESDSTPMGEQVRACRDQTGRWGPARWLIAIAALVVLLASCGKPELTNETIGGPANGTRGSMPCGGTETPPVAGPTSTPDPASLVTTTTTTDPTPTPTGDPPSTSTGPGAAASVSTTTGSPPAAAGDPVSGTMPASSAVSPDPIDPSTDPTAGSTAGTRPAPIERGSTPGTLPCTPSGGPAGTTVTGTALVPESAVPATGPTGPTADYAGAADTLTMGGPGATVGNEVIDRDCPQFQPTSQPPCGPQPGFWAAITGPLDNYTNGDPYSTRCGPQSTGPGSDPSSGSSQWAGAKCSPLNSLYRPLGYTYAIDVAPRDVGRPLSVDGYDLGVYQRTSSTTATDRDCNTKLPPFATVAGTPSVGPGNGFGASSCQTGDGGDAQNFDLEVFDNGGTDGTIRFDRSLSGCHLTMAANDLTAQAGTFKNNWVRVCTFTPTQVGVHAIRVRNSGLPGLPDVGSGTNAYALRVAGGTATRLYPVGDQSVWMNMPGGSARLPLARVPERFAGRRLVIDAFDPGDGSGSSQFTVTVKPPDHAEPYQGDAGRLACSYNATPATDRGPATPDHAEACTVMTKQAGSSSSLYNGKWLRIVVDLDPGYRCPTDCYWSLAYDFGSASYPTDRVVWSAAIE